MICAALAARSRGLGVVAQPVRAADDAAQRTPVPIDLQPDDPEPLAVAGHVVVHARVGHGLALPDRDGVAGHQKGVEVEADGVGALPVQRGGHELPCPSARAGNQSRTHRRGEGHARRVVSHAAPLKRRCVTGTGQQVRHPRARPERSDVVGGAVGVGSRVAVTGDEPVYQARIGGGHRLEVQTHPA